MLQITSDKIAYVIIRARDYDSGISAWGSEGRGQHGNEDELRAFIAGLNEDEQASLIALAWIGRGDYSGEEFDEARTLARERNIRDAAEYLLGIDMLGDMLEEGLAELGLSLEDTD